ncbi:MAG TPA: lysylphosphatidylglycerol synthase domain-containing protein, partial [Candidatus Krumholzibacteria bacterium]|nr:lysylphosphatidylglycerol synthase domain-containing protein [Candidatus Krumholzibacteria bacterium]
GFTVHHLILIAAGALIASPLLGSVVRPGMANVLIALTVAGTILVASGVWVRPLNMLQRRRRKPLFALASRFRVLAALGSAGLGWVCYGTAMVVVAVAITPETSSQDFLRIGLAAVAAWLVGFLSFVAPAGFGVREGTFVLLARPIMPEANAMAVALIWRLLFTAVQIPLGAIALTVLARKRPATALEPTAESR